jgi:DNA replication protein DnaC
VTSPSDDLREKATQLGLHGVLAHWAEYAESPWLPALLEREEAARGRRSLDRRIKAARIGRFKLLADFDWTWPKRIDRNLVDELMTLDFLVADKETGACSNVVFVGPNGVGKSTLAQNVAHKAVLEGHTVRFATASELLNDLVSQESASSLARRIQRYTKPQLLVVDEVGYLSYDSRHADLLFEVVSRRSQKSTMITTNRPFAEWAEIFPNASSVVALVDRLMHRAEVVEIVADCSYRAKEAKEREARRAAERANRRRTKRKRAS